MGVLDDHGVRHGASNRTQPARSIRLKPFALLGQPGRAHQGFDGLRVASALRRDLVCRGQIAVDHLLGLVCSLFKKRRGQLSPRLHQGLRVSATPCLGKNHGRLTRHQEKGKRHRDEPVNHHSTRLRMRAPPPSKLFTAKRRVYRVRNALS